MVSSNANALGVIFANSYDNLVPELVAERTMASIPFAGRYRMIDFVLSNMANAGVDNVSVIVRKNYHSLMDHLGAGREWDLTRKRGGLNIVPPFAERSIKLYSGRVDALASVLNWLRDQKERYVILSDSNIAMNFDFNKLIEAHVKSGADVTMVYNRGEIPEVLGGPDGYQLDAEVQARYAAWLAEHPYEMGTGWAQEPWFQPEMPLDEDFVRAAAQRAETAFIVIGRTAGEDQDNSNTPGSFLLTEGEENMLALVCRQF